MGTIKHGHHAAQLDVQGTDTWRHYNEGMAKRVILDAPDSRAIFERKSEEGDPIELTRKHMSDCDIVIVEGFKSASIPKVEVYRHDLDKELIYRDGAPNSDEWIAVVTNDRNLSLPIPVFNFGDTSWLPNLAYIIWDKARVLEY